MKGRPKYYKEDIILEYVSKIPANSSQITKELREAYPSIHTATVIRILENLKELKLVEEIYNSKNIRLWSLPRNEKK